MKNSTILFTLVLSCITASAQIHHIQEDFNSGALPIGWTNNAVNGTLPWQFGLDGANAETGNNNLDSSSFVFFDDDAAGNGANNTVELISPSFDNSTDSIAILEFDYNLRVVSNQTVSDSFMVDVYDGAIWNRVFSTQNVDDCGRYNQGLCLNGFPHAAIDISAFKNPNCQVKFTYFDGNAWAWYVGLDNVEIYSYAENDAAITALLSPSNSCNLDSAEIKVNITNFGTSDINTPFNVTVDINNGAQQITETINSNISPFDTISYTFNQKAYLNSVGQYDIKTYTTLAADTNYLNDTLKSEITYRPAYFLPYFYSFETTDSLWTFSGINSSWEIGIPNNTNINSAISGTNILATNLNGNYNNNEISYVTTPCFDLSSDTNAPVLAFDLNHITELIYDSLKIEYSINDGVTWNKVLTNTDTAIWYGNKQNWRGNSNGWNRKTAIIKELKHQKSVIFRFAFSSDGSGQGEGIGIDDFTVRFQDSVDLSLDSFNLINNLIGCNSTTSKLSIKLDNIGFKNIDTTYIYYNGNSGIVHIDTLNRRIDISKSFIYVTKNTVRIDSGQNNLSVWIKTKGDILPNNDSILNQLYFQGSSSFSNFYAIPYNENFDSFIPTYAPNGVGDSLVNGWVRNTPSSSNVYSWRVTSGTTPSSSTGPLNDVTGGNYLFTEASSGGSPITLTSPCIQLPNDTVLEFSFASHRYGASINQLSVEVFNGLTWNYVDTLIGQNQTASADPWDYNTYLIDVIPNAKSRIRFTAERGADFKGDIAIDDIFIYDLKYQDVNIIRNNTDLSICNIDSNVSLSITLSNEGGQSILPNELLLNYNLNGTIYTEIFNDTIKPHDTVTYTFSNPLLLSTNISNFDLTIYSTLSNDTIKLNDTLSLPSFSVKPTYKLPYYNNFDDFQVKNIKPSLVTPDWLRLPGDRASAFNWEVYHYPYDPQILSSNQDLLHNFTAIKADSYDSTLSDAILETPCFAIDSAMNPFALISSWDLQTSPSINDDFYYVDIHDGNSWIDNYSVLNPNNVSYQLDSISLLPFRGKTVKLRIRAKSNATFISIDDIHVTELLNQDVWIRKPTSPLDNCNLSASESITIPIKNVGLNMVPANQLILSYNIGSTTVNETVPFTIPIDSTIFYTFNQSVNLSQIDSTYEIRISATLPGDTNHFNNEVLYAVSNTTKRLPYFEGFENLNDDLCVVSARQWPGHFDFNSGWNSTETQAVKHWLVSNSSYCKYNNNTATWSNNTGPASAYSGESFVYLESSSYGNGILTSPCFNLTGHSNAFLEFYINNNTSGHTVFNAEIDVNNSGNWQSFFNIFGTSGNSNWNKVALNLNIYKDSIVQFRFNYSWASATTGDIAIDHFKITDSIVTNISESSPQENSFNLYPNPNTGSFSLKVTPDMIGMNYQVFDIRGALVKEARILNELSNIKLNEVEKGIYLLKIEGHSITQKVVIY